MIIDYYIWPCRSIKKKLLAFQLYPAQLPVVVVVVASLKDKLVRDFRVREIILGQHLPPKACGETPARAWGCLTHT